MNSEQYPQLSEWIDERSRYLHDLHPAAVVDTECSLPPRPAVQTTSKFQSAAGNIEVRNLPAATFYRIQQGVPSEIQSASVVRKFATHALTSPLAQEVALTILGGTSPQGARGDAKPATTQARSTVPPLGASGAKEAPPAGTPTDSLTVKPTEKKEKMTDISREELDAKLERTEARMDARVARMEGMISNIAQSQAESRREIELMRTESRQDNKSTRTTIIVTAVSAVLAIVGGVAAFNATVLSNMVSSFESGKNTMQSLNQVSSQLNDAAKRMNEIEQRLEQQRAATAATAAATATSSSPDKPDSQKK